MGFFKSFKDHLDQDYGGRYVAVVLKELLCSCPGAAAAIFGRRLDFETADVEVALRAYGGGLRSERRADIALFNAEREIVGLIELKYEDQKNERNHAQLSDYLKFSKRYDGRRPVPLIVVTKSPLPEKEERQIERNAHIAKCISYGDVVRRIRGLAAESPVAKMVVEYLKEEAPMFKKINKDALQLLMLNALNVKNNHGLGRQHTHEKIQAAPQMLGNLIENMSVLGDTFNHNCAPDKVRPITSFSFAPEIVRDERNCAKKDLDEDGIIDSSRIHAGNLWVFYRYNLFKWRAVLELGIGVELKVGRNRPLNTFLYSQVWHRKYKDTDFSSQPVNLERITEDKALKIINGLAMKVIKAALKRPLDRLARANLMRMRRRLAGI